MACSSGSTSAGFDDPSDPTDPRVDNGFESDDPTGGQGPSRGGDYGEDAGNGASGAAGTGGAPSAGGDDGAARAIEEADIVKVQGDRLYTLSRYGGLGIIDVSVPAKLKLIGRKRLGGQPFEMYLRGRQAYVMLNDFGRYVPSDDGSYGRYEQTSEMVALDLSDERNVQELAHYDIPGSIADSRLVGDAMYVVTQENGYCWGCQDNQPGAVVTSFNIASGGIARVDQLAFRSPQNGYSWQRSVSATSSRLYIAGPEYDWQPGQERANSIIQVVDIQDPTGRLRKGADVPVHGQIMSRWQMDEYGGVLRVVSQNTLNQWNGGEQRTLNPSVQTFRVTDANTITPLGQTELVLPKPETLRSVRFDGPRGYAITAEQTDPLYTIDLSDPAAPRQLAELHMPGWITHLEPRGDRLIGFGYADTTWNSPLAVSLFDVADLAAPRLLERVEFSGGGGSYAEDQDRIHKSVQVLDDQGLVLVPFASYGNWNGTSCDDSESGIQIIDYSRDHLVKRGVAPQYGQSRRAMVLGDHLLGMSDRTVTSFDLRDKDAPTQASEVDLSNPTFRLTRVGDQIASVTNDWWTGEVMLSLTPAASPDDAAVTAKLSLAGLAKQSAALCGNGSSWANWYAARLFPMGQHLVVTVPVMTYDDTAQRVDNEMVYGVVDLSTPTAPRLLRKLSVPLEASNYSYYGCGGFFDGWGYSAFYGGSLLADGESMVQVGSRLAYLESIYSTRELHDAWGAVIDWTPVMERKLHVVDFTDAEAPRVHPALELGSSRGSTPLLVSGTQVLTSRWRRSPSRASKIKFYVDRVELGGDEPVRLPSINTPGSLVNVDAASGRLVTVDYRRQSVPMSYEECYYGNGSGTGWFDHQRQTCEQVTRTFHLSDVDADSRVTLRSSLVPPSQRLGAIKTAEDRVYLLRSPAYSYDQDRVRVTEPGALLALGGIRAGELTLVSQVTAGVQWPLAARGPRIALATDRGFAVFDTSTPTATALVEQTLQGGGYASDVLLEQDRAVCSLGDWGMQTLSLRP